MQDVFGIAGPPPRKGVRLTPWGRVRPRLRDVATPGLTALVLTAMILHLLVELASRLSYSDPVGTLSVMAGMIAVLVTLLPFTALCLHRAHTALRAQADWYRPPGGRLSGSA